MQTPRLTTQAAIIGLGRLLNMAAAAGTLVVLARTLESRADYGAICQLIVLYMALSQIFAVGLPQSTYFFLPRYEGGERRGFLTQTVVLLMLSGVLLGIGLYTGADVLGRVLNSPELPRLLRIFAIYPVFMLPTLAVEGTLLFARRPLAVVIYNAVIRVGMFCALVVPTLLGASLVMAVTTWMLVGAAMWLSGLVLIFSTVRGLPFVWRIEMLREEKTFALPLALGSLAAVCGTYLDRALASHTFGAEAFGIYTNATVEIPTVTMVTNATGVVLMAEFSRRTSAGEFEAVMQIWHQAMLKSGVLVYASLGFLAFWGHETMRLLFSARYADSGTIFSIYVWIIPVIMLTGQSLFIALGATTQIVILTVIGLALGIVCILIFGHWFGLPGMALGTIVARYLGQLFAIHWYVRWLTKIGWRKFLPWRQLGTALCVALGAGFVSRAMAPLANHLWAPAVYALGLLLFGITYVIGLYMTHLLGYAVPARLLPERWRPREGVEA